MGDPITEKGPHGFPGSQMGAQVAAVTPPTLPIPVTRVSDMMVGAVNQKQTPSSLPPHSTFLTEVTSMTLPPHGKTFFYFCIHARHY